MIYQGAYRPHLLPKIRSNQIMAAAAGMPCTLRIATFYPGFSCAGPETTVSCHLDNLGPAGGKGTATKPTDMAAVFGCKHCHDIMSGADLERHKFVTLNYEAAVLQRIIHALRETHALLIQQGVIIIPDGEEI